MGVSVSAIIQVEVHDYDSILFVRATERRYMMSRVFDCQMEGAK